LLSPGDGSQQINLVAVRQRTFEVIVDGAAAAVPHEGVTQVRTLGDRRPQADSLPLRLVEELLQSGAHT